MNKISITLPLFLALVLALAPLVHGQQLTNSATEEATKIKAEAIKRVDKKENRVKIKLRNGAEMRGRITQTAEDSFTLTNEKTGAKTDINYTDVQKLSGQGMSKKTKILIATGVGVAIIAVVVAIGLRDLDDFSLAGINTQ